MDVLVAAYPEFLAGHAGGQILWKDGTRQDFSATRGPEPSQPRSAEVLLAAPALADMFHWRYPLATPPAAPPVYPADPGRVRVAAFFTRMYGDCRKGEVAAHLVAVPWLPNKRGGTVRVTRVNGVADRVARISAALDVLPPKFDKFLVPSAGAYHCRAIAGTERLSAHGTGTAIDLAVRPAHYWRWTKPDRTGRPVYRNAVPPEIVAIFEQHGFIWGGKWSHYDTMHFEYRPEILAAGQ